MTESTVSFAICEARAKSRRAGSTRGFRQPRVLPRPAFQIFACRIVSQSKKRRSRGAAAHEFPSSARSAVLANARKDPHAVDPACGSDPA
jgi:hypothetical protein